MKRCISFFLSTLVVLCHGNAPALGQPYDFSSITQLLDDSSARYADRIYIEVYKNNEQIFKYQKGWLNCDNVRLGVASSTKWISGAVFLRLSEKGWFALDDSIGIYLPIFSRYGKGHITLRQSYSMSSGIFQEGERNQYHRDPRYTLAESVDSIAKNVPILYPTGTMIGYDGTMMHAWGRVAEMVDSINGRRRGWRTIAKEELFDLLDMDQTDYTDFLPNPAVAGGIETTPCDYLKFLRMLANHGMHGGDTVLQQSSIDEMFVDQTGSAPIFHTYWPSNHPYFPNGMDTMRYTFGAWWLEKDINGNVIAITSPGYYGHYPFYDRCRDIYGTFFCYIPLTQGGGTQVLSTYLRFLDLMREEVGPCDSTLGIVDIESPVEINVYPSPNQGTFMVSAPRSMRRISVYSRLGRLMETVEIDAQRHAAFDATNYAQGMYFLRIEMESGTSSVKNVFIYHP